MSTLKQLITSATFTVRYQAFSELTQGQGLAINIQHLWFEREQVLATPLVHLDGVSALVTRHNVLTDLVHRHSYRVVQVLWAVALFSRPDRSQIRGMDD